VYRKTVFLSLVIGVITGVAAWAFHILIGLIYNFALLGQFSADYDANQHTPESPLGWLVIFVPVLGGIVVIWLIRNFAPEAKGHGVPAVVANTDPANPLAILLYFPFALIIGLFALVFIRCIYYSEDFFDTLPLNPYVRHMLGMLLLGILMYTLLRTTGLP